MCQKYQIRKLPERFLKAGETRLVHKAVAPADLRAYMESQRHLAFLGMVKKIPHSGIVERQIRSDFADSAAAPVLVVINDIRQIHVGRIRVQARVNTTEWYQAIRVFCGTLQDILV